MMTGWPSSEQQIQLAKDLQQEYANRIVLRGEGAPELTIVLEHNTAAEPEQHKSRLLVSMKILSPDEPSVIKKRCIAMQTALLTTVAVLAQQPTSPSLESEVDSNPSSSLPPELLQVLEEDDSVMFFSVDSSDEESDGSAIGMVTSTYSSNKQALHSALKNNRRTQRQLERALGPDCMDPLD